jgi:molecular chaperone GrpE (heat shock protein)
VRSLATTLRAVLGRMGAAPIAVDVGAATFDPTWHRCVGVLDASESPFPDAAPRTVVRVVDDGYVLDGRLLAPAAVEIQAGRTGAGIPPDTPAEPDIPTADDQVSE